MNDQFAGTRALVRLILRRDRDVHTACHLGDGWHCHSAVRPAAAICHRRELGQHSEGSWRSSWPGKAASAFSEHAVAPKHGGKSAGLQPGGHQFLGRKEEIAFW